MRSFILTLTGSSKALMRCVQCWVNLGTVGPWTDSPNAGRAGGGSTAPRRGLRVGELLLAGEELGGEGGVHGGPVVDADLEAGGAPVRELDDCGDGRVDILGHDVASVEHAAGHVVAMARATLHHLVGRLEAGFGNLSHTELLWEAFLAEMIGVKWILR